MLPTGKFERGGGRYVLLPNWDHTKHIPTNSSTYYAKIFLNYLASISMTRSTSLELTNLIGYNSRFIFRESLLKKLLISSHFVKIAKFTRNVFILKTGQSPILGHSHFPIFFESSVFYVFCRFVAMYATYPTRRYCMLLLCLHSSWQICRRWF